MSLYGTKATVCIYWADANQGIVVGAAMFLVYHYGRIDREQAIVGKEDIS